MRPPLEPRIAQKRVGWDKPPSLDVGCMTYLPIEEVKRRNEIRRGTYRYVPEEVIDHMNKMGAQMDMSSYGVRVLDPREVQITV